jgi:hypothetical protein
MRTDCIFYMHLLKMWCSRNEWETKKDVIRYREGILPGVPAGMESYGFRTIVPGSMYRPAPSIQVPLTSVT